MMLGIQNHEGRIKSIDVAKGMIVLIIVFVHLIWGQPIKNGLAFEHIYAEGNVPLMMGYLCLMMFFIISGYFFRKGRSVWENLKKNALKLFVAVASCKLVLPLILAGVLVVVGQTPDFNNYLQSHIYNMFGSENMFLPYGETRRIGYQLNVEAAYYFFIAMVAAFVIFYPLAYRVLDDDKKLIVSIVVLVSATFVIRQFLVRPPFYLDLAFLGAAFMLVGAKLGRTDYIERMENGEWKSKKIIVALAICFVAAAVMLYFLPSGVEFSISVFGNYEGLSAYPFFVESLLCCFIGMFVFILLAKIPVFSDLICVIGRHSLGVVLLSYFVSKCLIALFYRLPLYYNLPTMDMLTVVCVWVATLVICLFVCVNGKLLIKRVQEKLVAKNQ